MTSYLDEQLNEYENAEVASFFNLSPKVQLVDPPEKKETIPETIGRASVKGVVKGMIEAPNNLATIVGLPVDIMTAGLNKLGLDIQYPIMGSQMLQDGINFIRDSADQLVPSSLNKQFNDYLSKPYDNQLTGQLSEAIAQFGTTAIPAASFVKLATNTNPFTRSLIWGGIADATAFNANDQTLVGQLISNPEGVSEEDTNAFREMLGSLLEKYEDDPEAAKLAKSSLEGMAIGGLLETAFKVGRKIPWKKVLTGGGLIAGSVATSDAEAGVGSKIADILISPRNPQAVNRTEDPIKNYLSVGLAESKTNKAQFDHNIGILSDYPNLKVSEITNKSTDEIAETYINHAKNNLLYLFDKVPPATRNRSKLWYVGANKIAQDFSKKYGVSLQSASGVLAALSPQKDWYMNVSLAERTLDIVTNKKDFVYDAKMRAMGLEKFGKPQYKKLLDAIDGKKLSELETPEEKAIWVRIYDETFNDRSFKVITPEGNMGDFVLTDDGVNARAAWNSNVMIKNAIIALESNGDKAIISGALGDAHKVRSFYNNIVDPNSKNGDVTIDTHAVAAATLRPVGGKHTIVNHNFGTAPSVKDQKADWKGATKNSKVNGIKGLYSIYAEAYRRAAAERGVLPREMQSITWEAVRGLFPSTFKQSPKKVEAIDSLWYKYRNNELSLDEVINGIERETGGIEKPTWEQ
mgnify:FL=1|tara:strand:+ start:23593 stop:25665 length:2073 start_codon:yes stop_codon:yes gene_type:complete